MKKEPNFRNSMKISSLLLATAFTAFAVPANATGLEAIGNDNMSIQETQQTKTVTGTVIDAAGIPVIGANVLLTLMVTSPWKSLPVMYWKSPTSATSARNSP